MEVIPQRLVEGGSAVVRIVVLALSLLSLSGDLASAQVMLEYSTPLRNAPHPRVLFPDLPVRAPGGTAGVRPAAPGGVAGRVERLYARLHQWHLERALACQRAWGRLTPQAQVKFAALSTGDQRSAEQAKAMTRAQALAYLAGLKARGSFPQVITNPSLLTGKEREAFDQRGQALTRDMAGIGAPAVAYLMAELEVCLTEPALAQQRLPQRTWAMQCLERMGRPAADALAAFLERELAAAARPDLQMKALLPALSALAKAGPLSGGRLADIARLALSYPEPRVRAAAICLLGREQSAAALPVLVQALSDSQPQVQLVACGLLAEKGDACALPALRALASLASSDEERALVSARAQAAMTAICKRTGASP